MTPDPCDALLDRLIEAVLTVDATSHRVLSANRNACRMLGTERGKLIGRPILDFAASPEDQCFWDEARLGLTEQIWSETMLRRDDDSLVHVDRRIARLPGDGLNGNYLVALTDRSAQRKVEDELEKLVAELRASLESTADGILVVDLGNGIRSYNQRFAELWELPLELMTRRDDHATHAWLAEQVVDRPAYEAKLEALGESALSEATDLITLRSGRILERVSLPQYARGQPVGRVFSFRDITQQLADQTRLQLAAKVFAASLDSIIVADNTLHIVAANAQTCFTSGYDELTLIGLDAATLFYKPDVPDFIPQLFSDLADQGSWEGELWCRRKDGSGIPGLGSFARTHDDDAAQYVMFFKDLSETLAAKRRIEELAYSDTLTSLPNRVMLGERIEFARTWSTREQRSFAVLFIDLDRFKQINDSLGHQFGDRVLIEAARRIRNCLRQCDTAARLGGDEFLLLLHDIDARGAEATASRILIALSQPYELDAMTMHLTCSIGIALYPTDGETADDLIKNADTAMYRVKEEGRAGFRFYQRQMNNDFLARIQLEQAMREALRLERFRLCYQPQVNLADGAILGVEALIRWSDPELGDIPPTRFIPQAEESGLIVAIGRWVLNEAIRQASHWHRQGLALRVAVNVSAMQFQNAEFVPTVATALERSGLPPARLELELTESILIRDADAALLRLQALADLGVRLSIDDFGTGYSSLSYLKRFPIHKLKIDRSFVAGLPADESDIAISSAIISVGRALKLDVIAEGVETEAQRQFLARAGCGQYQGFLCAPGLPPASIEALLAQTQAGDDAPPLAMGAIGCEPATPG